VGIGQAASIENKISVQRNTVFKSKGLEQHHQRRIFQIKNFFYPAPKDLGLQITCIQWNSKRLNIGQQLSLAGNAIHQCLNGAFAKNVLCCQHLAERMPAPGFRVALHEYLVTGIEKDDSDIVASFSNLFEIF